MHLMDRVASRCVARPGVTYSLASHVCHKYPMAAWHNASRVARKVFFLFLIFFLTFVQPVYYRPFRLGSRSG